MSLCACPTDGAHARPVGFDEGPFPVLTHQRNLRVIRDRKNIFKLALSREKLLISQDGSDSLRVGFQEMVTGPDRFKRLARARSTKS
jgi:hypothetical protein